MKNLKFIIKGIYRWATATRLRKILSSTLAVLILLTSIRYIFLPTREVKAADMLFGLNEGYGTSTSDTNSSVSAMTINGAVWKSEEYCKVGKCLYFDGDQDYATVADASTGGNLDFAAADSFTIEGWFRHKPSPSGVQWLARKIESAGSDGGYKVQMETDGNITCALEDNDGDNVIDDTISSTSASYADNQWHHFACVKSGTTSLTLYMDGVQVAQSTSLNSTLTLENDDAFGIGIAGDLTSNDYEGFLDEVKVMRSARTVDQIKADITGQTPARGTSASFGPDQSWLSSGLVGYWKMDETSWSASNCGTTKSVLDSSGNSNNGSSCPTTTGPTAMGRGKFGAGGSFDGTDDYVQVTDADQLSFADNKFTATAWVKRSGNPGVVEYIILKGVSTWEYNMRVSLGGKLQATLWNSGGTTIATLTGNTTITDGNWHHVAITADGVNFSVYVDGVLDSVPAPLTGTMSNTTANLYFGDRSDVANSELQGELDDIRIYNRPLSDSEIVGLYNWAPGPVGYWKMDENTGQTVNDSSGNGSSGSLGLDTSVGSDDPAWSTGKFGSSVSLDGSDDGVQIAGASALHIGGSVSISTWINLSTENANTKNIITKGTSARYYIDLDANEKVEFNISGGTNLVSNSTIPLNQWTHIGAVFDTDENKKYIFINGILDNSNSETSDPIASEAGVYVGSYNLASEFFPGKIDDIKVYSYARTSGQVVEDMNAGHPAPGSPIGSAVSYWKFDEGYGTTAYDSSINANNLTLSTASWTNSGKFGKAFNGLTNVRASITDDANDEEAYDFAAADNATFSLWFKSDSATNPSANEYLLQKGGNIATDAIGYAIYTSSASDGLICFGIDDDATTFPEDSVCSTTDLYDNTWHHLVVTKTGTSRLDMYVDGKPNGTPDTSISATGTLANAATFYIGDTNGTDGTDEFLGDIDEVKVYRLALNIDQAKVEYNRGSAVVMGSSSTDSSGNATWSAENEYCPPGQGTTCTPPVAHWKLDENTGTTSVNDSSGRGNTATMTGSMTSDDWMPGKYGSSLNFDGSDDALTIATANDADFDYNGAEAFSGSAWVKVASGGMAGSGQQDAILAKWDDTAIQRAWRLYLTNDDADSTGNFAIVLRDQSQLTTISASTATDSVSENTWYHIEFTFNGGTAGTANDLKIYMNGILITGNTLNASFLGIEDQPADFTIGDYDIGNVTATQTPFTGLIDDVRIYNYMRTDAQIAWDYNRGKPYAWWKFDEGTSTTANDSGIGSNTGTLVNTPTWITGVYNGALTFASASSEDVSIANESNFDFERTDKFSISAWIKDTTAATEAKIFTKMSNTAPNTGYEFFVSSSNTLQAYFINSWSGNAISVNGSTNVSDSAWHYVTMTYDGSSTAAGIQFYVDGRPETMTINVNTLSSSILNDITPRIGSRNNTNYFFNGSIDDVKVFKYTLNAKQVQLLYNENGAIRFGQ